MYKVVDGCEEADTTDLVHLRDDGWPTERQSSLLNKLTALKLDEREFELTHSSPQKGIFGDYSKTFNGNTRDARAISDLNGKQLKINLHQAGNCKDISSPICLHQPDDLHGHNVCKESNHL